MENKPILNRIFKSSEEVISMFLGLVIVVSIVGLIYNYFQKRRGNIDLPGLTVQKENNLGDKLIDNTKTKLTNEKKYIVKKSDSLWKIAEQNYGSGYNWVDISKANKLKSPGLLVEGQELILPAVETKNIVKTITNETNQKIEIGDGYKVLKGDSLWKISVRAYGDGYKWVSLWQANKIKLRSPDKLEIGMVLNIPSLK